MVTAVGQVPVAVVGVRDPPRPEAARVVAALQRAGKDVWMITGDARCAAHVAHQFCVQPLHGSMDGCRRAFNIMSMEVFEKTELLL